MNITCIYKNDKEVSPSNKGEDKSKEATKPQRRKKRHLQNQFVNMLKELIRQNNNIKIVSTRMAKKCNKNSDTDNNSLRQTLYGIQIHGVTFDIDDIQTIGDEILNKIVEFNDQKELVIEKKDIYVDIENKIILLSKSSVSSSQSMVESSLKQSSTSCCNSMMQSNYGDSSQMQNVESFDFKHKESSDDEANQGFAQHTST